MHQEVEYPEALPALRRTPHDCEADAGNQPLDEISALLAELDFIEQNEADAGRFGAASSGP
jgi:hypothetical protein